MPAMNKARPIDLREAHPFHRNANPAYKSGYMPFPLPERSKAEPPVGATGYKHPTTHAKWKKKLEGWLKPGRFPKASSIGVRLPEGVLCLDVDAYKEAGAHTLELIAEETGIEIPDTWRQSARHDGVSGHYMFRVPKGLKWPSAAGPGIECVHYGHRYLVSAPSIHEKQGDDPAVGTYLWYEPGDKMDGNGSLDYPNIADLPELPEEWIEFITKGMFAKSLPEKKFSSVSERDKAISNWIAEGGNAMCAETLRLVTDAEAEMGSGAHDYTTPLIYRLTALAAEGHRGLETALERVRTAFVGEVGRDDRAGGTKRGLQQLEAEWGRMRDGAVKKVMLQQENSLFEGYPDECNCASLSEDGRPVPEFDIRNLDLNRILPKAYECCGPVEQKGLYLRGDDTVYYRATSRHQNQPLLEEMERHSLRDYLNTRVHFYRTTGGENPVPLSELPPDRILDTMLKSGRRFEHLPVIHSFHTAPVWVKRDGKVQLIRENGYNPESGLLLDMSPELQKLAATIPAKPTRQQMEEALETLWEPLRQFPYDSPGSKGNLLAALLAPSVRALIPGNTPAYLFEAPTPRTGKSLLADICAIINCGGLRGDQGVQKYAVEKGRGVITEFAKELSSSMREAPAIVYGDNLDFYLDSSVFAAVMTAYPEVQVRVLGVSKNMTLSTDTTHYITSNNLELSEENLGRVTSIRLDSGMDRPNTRNNFALPNVKAYVTDNRAELLYALHTVIAYWVSQGCPRSESVVLGGFEEWAAVMGGLLECVGRPYLDSNRKDFENRARDDLGMSFEGFVEEWASTFNVGSDNATSATNLLGLDSSEALVGSNMTESGRRQQFGRAIRPHLGRVYCGYKVARGKLGRDVVYWLEGGRTPPKPKRRVVKRAAK